MELQQLENVTYYLLLCVLLVFYIYHSFESSKDISSSVHNDYRSESLIPVRNSFWSSDYSAMYQTSGCLLSVVYSFILSKIVFDSYWSLCGF